MKKIIGLILLLVVLSSFISDESADVVSQLRERVDAFNKKFKRAKIDLFFSQPEYAPGDTALVRTLYLSATDLKPVEGRQLVYVELYNDQASKVAGGQIMVSNGFASTSLAIPKDISPGIYLLVAYSDWMKNMDASLFFRQDFRIVGKDQVLKSKLTEDKLNIAFYPEGGHLVSGIENNLLLQLTGELNTGTGVIRSDTGTVATVHWDENGLAEIRMTPRAGTRYYAEVVVNGQQKKFDLPGQKPNGISIATAVDEHGRLNVRILHTSDLDLKKKYTLVATNARGVIYSRPLEFQTSGPLEFLMPEELPGGIAQLQVVDGTGMQWLQRVILIGGKSMNSVGVKLSARNYATREDVNLEIEVLDKSGNPVEGHFSARVTNLDLFGNTSNPRSGENLSLYGDILPTLRLKSGADDKEINRYLISQDCPWLNWNRILSEPPVATKFVPQSTITLSGTAVSLETGEPVGDSTQVMFFLQKQIFGYEIYTNSKGQFKCPILFDFAGADDVFVAASRKGKDLHGITIKLDKPDTTYNFRAASWKALEEDEAYGQYTVKKNLIEQSYSFFSTTKEKKDSVADPNAALEDELQGADITLKMSDYLIFPTMPDLIREVLRSVDYRKIGGRDIVRIYTTGKRPTNSASPLYVIDGVLTKSTTTFLSIKPADILTVKVIKDSNKLAKFGSLGVNGVIMIRTKNSSRKPAIRQENTFPLVGISPKVIDKNAAPNRYQANTSIPDLRPCLFWGPDLMLDHNGKAAVHFRTSDDVGNFAIQIEGLSKDGIPFFVEEKFQVKYHQP